MTCRAAPGTIAQSLAQVQQLKELGAALKSSVSLGRCEPRRFPDGDLGDRVGWVSTSDVPANTPIMAFKEDVAITQVDAEKHEVVGEVAAASSELVALTLWLIAERAKGAASPYHDFLSSLPVSTGRQKLQWLGARLPRGCSSSGSMQRRGAAGAQGACDSLRSVGEQGGPRIQWHKASPQATACYGSAGQMLPASSCRSMAMAACGMCCMRAMHGAHGMPCWPLHSSRVPMQTCAWLAS